MKHFRWAVLPFAVAVFLALTCCSACSGAKEAVPENIGTIILMTWNVNNLFDGKDNGFEYAEFLESAGWSNEKYIGRVNAISAAIGAIQPPPDIIMFQEIESLKIIEDIAASLSGGYGWSHFAVNPGASLGLGILSRLPILQASAHSITIDGETAPRPVLEARVKAGEGEFAVFVCHWKSKLGDEEVTERVRRSSARVILRRIRELWENEPLLGVIAAGDLNENHDEFFRQGASKICALLPDDPFCAELTGCAGADGRQDAGKQRDFIVLSKNKPPVPVHFPQEAVVLFSPWLRDLEKGSYYYKHEWETIDHFLISGQFFDGAGWEYEKAVTADFSPFVNLSGVPVSYNVRTGSGLSDHLPLLLTLKMAANINE
jgi:endonuclease/exonuclease/phosphatase family metal-dependent hydrolase